MSLLKLKSIFENEIKKRSEEYIANSVVNVNETRLNYNEYNEVTQTHGSNVSLGNRSGRDNPNLDTLLRGVIYEPGSFSPSIIDRKLFVNNINDNPENHPFRTETFDPRVDSAKTGTIYINTGRTIGSLQYGEGGVLANVPSFIQKVTDFSTAVGNNELPFTPLGTLGKSPLDDLSWESLYNSDHTPKNNPSFKGITPISYQGVNRDKLNIRNPNDGLFGMGGSFRTSLVSAVGGLIDGLGLGGSVSEFLKDTGKEPYIVSPIGDAGRRINFNFLDRGTAIAPAITDAIRIAKFLTSPMGIIFIGKQELLSRQGQKFKKSYNPIGTIASAGTKGLVGAAFGNPLFDRSEPNIGGFIGGVLGLGRNDEYPNFEPDTTPTLASAADDATTAITTLALEALKTTKSPSPGLSGLFESNLGDGSPLALAELSLRADGKIRPLIFTNPSFRNGQSKPTYGPFREQPPLENEPSNNEEILNSKVKDIVKSSEIVVTGKKYHSLGVQTVKKFTVKKTIRDITSQYATTPNESSVLEQGGDPDLSEYPASFITLGAENSPLFNKLQDEYGGMIYDAPTIRFVQTDLNRAISSVYGRPGTPTLDITTAESTAPQGLGSNFPKNTPYPRGDESKLLSYTEYIKNETIEFDETYAFRDTFGRVDEISKDEEVKVKRTQIVDRRQRKPRDQWTIPGIPEYETVKVEEPVTSTKVVTKVTKKRIGDAMTLAPFLAGPELIEFNNTVVNNSGFDPALNVNPAGNHFNQNADVVQSTTYGINSVKNGMPFYFKDLRDGAYIFFRAYLDGITENISPSWNPSNYVGRSEPVYIYERSEREINFNLKLFANSQDELAAIYQKMNKLTSLCYPEYYDDNYGNRMKPPLIKFRLGDMFGSLNDELMGYIKGLNYSIEQSSPWETSEGNRVPKYVNATIGFQVIHAKTPDMHTKFYGNFEQAKSNYVLKPIKQDANNNSDEPINDALLPTNTYVS